jgi:putative acetyltransferase
MKGFAPARTLYATAGFTPCGPFADYRLSPNSTFMTLSLNGPEPANGAEPAAAESPGAT